MNVRRRNSWKRASSTRQFLSIQDDFHSFPADVQKESMGKYTKSRIQDMIDFIYDNYDEFRLLLDASYGTEYQSFLDELVDIEVDYTYRYMKVTGCHSTESGEVSETFIHIIVTAYFNGFFEISHAVRLPYGGIQHRPLLKRQTPEHGVYFIAL